MTKKRTREEVREKILGLLNPSVKLTVDQITIRTGMSDSKIRKVLKDLKQEGILGSTKMPLSQKMYFFKIIDQAS